MLVFGALAGAVIGGWPAPLRLAAVIGAEIALMTYVLLPWLTRRLLPWLTRRLARWIFPRTVTA